MILPSVPSLSLFCIIVDGAVLGTILASASLPRMTFHARNKHAFRLRVRSFARSSVPPSVRPSGAVSERSIGSSFGVAGKREAGGRSYLSRRENSPFSSFPFLPPSFPAFGADRREGRGQREQSDQQISPKEEQNERAGGRRASPPSTPSLLAAHLGVPLCKDGSLPWRSVAARTPCGMVE